MGSGEKQPRHQTEEEDVDLDADTVETTVELFCDEETAESPHKIILWYNQDTPKLIENHFPKIAVHRQIGREITLGRNKAADVLMYDKHMARNYAAVTCRTNTAQMISFVLRNACDATKQKRITFTDPKGRVTDLLPTQEVELTEHSVFKLECVEFKVGIELGDVNSKSFELEVRPVGGKRRSDDAQNSGGPIDGLPAPRTGSIPGAFQVEGNLESAYIGLPLTSNINSGINSIDQVVPKCVATPLLSQYYGPGMGATSGPVAALPFTPVMAPQYQGGYQPVAQAHAMNPHQQQLGYGYCEIQQPRSYMSQPSAMHGACLLHHGVNSNQGQLLERGSGYAPLSSSQTCPCHQHGYTHGHQQSTQGLTVSQLAQAFSEARVTSPQLSASPRGIVTNPSTQDHSPVLYPSPANPRFRFPQPQPSHGIRPQAAAVGLSPDLSDLPRGPPLARLSSGQVSGQSIDLHPQIAATRHAVSETGRSQASNTKIPEEHEEKPT